MKTLRGGLAALILCSLSAFAQDTEVHAKPITDEEIKMMRSDLQTTKNQIIRDTMKFTPAESAVFWPIYENYADEQHAIADRRLKLITEYAQNLDSMTDTKANDITERTFKIDEDTLALRKKYYPKFVEALGAKRAAKFYQVDGRIHAMLEMQLSSEIPLIP